MAPKVAIIILNYNGLKDTIECLESLKQITYPNYQVIVVDNASKGNDADILEEKYKDYIILIRNKENLGFSEGNNTGIKYALSKDFDYIWLLNNDTVVDKEALGEMVKLAERDEKIGIVGSKFLYYQKPDVIQTLGGSDKITWKGQGSYIHPLEKDREEFNSNFEIKGYIYGASLLAKRKVIEEIGLLDKNYFMWAEEVDWCLRAQRKGWKLFYCGKSKVWHKEGASLGTDKEKKFLWKKSRRSTLQRFVVIGYLEMRNHLYFVNKNFGRGKMWLYFFIKNFPEFIRKFVGVIIFDDQKMARIKLLTLGIRDGIKGKMGKPKEFA